MKSAVAATHNASVVGGVGGFAGLFDVSVLKDYTRPPLATSTDGVGTKVAIAQALDIHDTIGFDLVGMVVDDIIVCGAKPLFMTDYIACGKVHAERIAAIVRGIAEACAQADVALVGGETAEHPGLLGVDEYDVAGAATGVVDAENLLGPDKVTAGDVLIALPSSGIHSNGYSLVRHIIAEAGWTLDREVPEFGRTLGEERSFPPMSTRASSTRSSPRRPVPSTPSRTSPAGDSRPTSPGVPPPGLVAAMSRDSWEIPAVFSVLGDLGGVPRADRERTWNLGVGMVLVTAAEAADEVLAASPGSWVLGEVRTDDGALATELDYVQGAKGVDGERRSSADGPRPAGVRRRATAARAASRAHGRGAETEVSAPLSVSEFSVCDQRLRSGPALGVVVVVFVVDVVLVRVLGVVRLIVVGIGGAGLLRVGAKLFLETIQVGVRAVVLELPGYLDLLCLCAAATHWRDPLRRHVGCATPD